MLGSLERREKLFWLFLMIFVCYYSILNNIVKDRSILARLDWSLWGISPLKCL